MGVLYQLNYIVRQTSKMKFEFMFYFCSWKAWINITTTYGKMPGDIVKHAKINKVPWNGVSKK